MSNSYQTNNDTRYAMLDKDGQPPLLFNWRARAVREVDELIGLCKGVLADGVVNEGEASFLLKWLETNRNSRDVWPCSVLYPRIQVMLEDGKLNSSEESELLQLLIDICGGNPGPLNAHSLTASLPLDDPVPEVVFARNLFCFTGKMLCGPRKACEMEVTKRGGGIVDGIGRDLSYLVIGTVGSRDWLHSTFGRKIEKAVRYREQGLPLRIICEERFVEALA